MVHEVPMRLLSNDPLPNLAWLLMSPLQGIPHTFELLLHELLLSYYLYAGRHADLPELQTGHLLLKSLHEEGCSAAQENLPTPSAWS